MNALTTLKDGGWVLALMLLLPVWMTMAVTVLAAAKGRRLYRRARSGTIAVARRRGLAGAAPARAAAPR